MKNRWGAGAITFFVCLFLRISICFALVLMDVVQFYASWKVYRFVFYLKLLKDCFFFVSLLSQEDFVHISIVFILADSG